MNTILDKLTNTTTAICLLASLSLSTGGYSQATHDACEGSVQHNISEQAVVFARAFTPQPPFSQKQFYNNWARGNIAFDNGTKAINILLSYNGWLDELMWLRELDFKTGVVAKENIEYFSLWIDNDRPTEHFRKVWVGGLMSSHIFMQVLTEGEYTLYCQRKVSYLVGKQEFINSYQYYIETNGRLQSFRPGWLRIVFMFPKEQRSHIRQIIRSNQLKLRNEPDLIKFFQILNENEMES